MQRREGSSHSFAGYLLEGKTGLNDQETAWLAGTMLYVTSSFSTVSCPLTNVIRSTAGMETVRGALGDGDIMCRPSETFF